MAKSREERQKRREWKRMLRKTRKEWKTQQKKSMGQERKTLRPKRKRGESKGPEREQSERYDLPYTRSAAEIPIKEIRNGIIHTTDGRYVKIIEVQPINFLHRSASEQRNIIYSYMGYLKIAPPELQMKTIAKKADISQFLKTINEDMEKEPDPRCRMLQQDYANLITSVGYKEAVTRRFFLIFQVDA